MGSKEHPPQISTTPERFVREENIHINPTFIKPGFKEAADTFDAFSESLSERGHNVYTLHEPRQLSDRERNALLHEVLTRARAWYAEHRPEVDEETLERLFLSIPPTIFDGAIQLIYTIEGAVRDGGVPITVVAHSRGALETAVAAMLRPDLFPSVAPNKSLIILMNPAGMTGKEGVQESIAVAASKNIRDQKMARVQATLGEKASNIGRVTEIVTKCLFSTVWSYIKAPRDAKKPMGQALTGALEMLFTKPQRSMKEAHDMANTDIFEFLRFLYAVHGIRIAVIYDEHDRLFNAEIIEARLEEHDYIEAYSTEDGTHFAPITKPKEIATIVNDISQSEKQTAS